MALADTLKNIAENLSGLTMRDVLLNMAEGAAAEATATDAAVKELSDIIDYNIEQEKILPLPEEDADAEEAGT